MAMRQRENGSDELFSESAIEYPCLLYVGLIDSYDRVLKKYDNI